MKQEHIRTNLEDFLSDIRNVAQIRKFLRSGITLPLTVETDKSTPELLTEFVDCPLADNRVAEYVWLQHMTFQTHDEENASREIQIYFFEIPDSMTPVQIIGACARAKQRPITFKELLWLDAMTSFSCFFLPALGSVITYKDQTCHAAFWDDAPTGRAREIAFSRVYTWESSRTLHVISTSVALPRGTIIPVVKLDAN